MGIKRRKVTRLDWKDWWQKNAKKQTGVRICDRCAAVLYDGHWHADPVAREALTDAKPRSASVEAFCPQCRYVMEGEGRADADFEGQVTLDGLHDAKEKDSILRTVRNYARDMEKRDPEDQIIALEDRGDRVIVATSDNQLAVGIGKAVDKAFKGGELRIVWSEDDKPARVYWKHKHTRH